MFIQNLSDQQTWDSFVQQFPQTSFLQSWAWGDFEHAIGYGVYRLGMYEKEQLIGVSLIIRVSSRRGGYLECIGGPLFIGEWKNGKFREWLAYVKDLAKKEGAVFLRLRLPFEDTSDERAFLKTYGFRETSLYYQAETTRIIDLDSNPDILISNMDKQTRYDIRRAEREGVIIEKPINQETTNSSPHLVGEAGFQIFLDLYHRMVARQGYVGYTDSYLQKQYETFAEHGLASLYLAKYRDDYVAGAIIFHYGDTTTYHHGASVPVTKLSPMAYLLWQAINDAKGKGDKFFDLFGTAPPGKRYMSRVGLTKFKEGFGGKEFQWLRTHDFVYQPLPYLLTRIVEQLPGGIRSKGAAIVRTLR